MNSPTTKLTEKEEEIMQLIWEYGPCHVRTLIEHMPEPRPHFNTVSTFVRILEQKGFVGRTSATGHGSMYYATVPQHTYRRSIIGNIVSKLFGSSFSMVSQLVEDDMLTPAQLRELADMAEKARENRNTSPSEEK